MLYREANGLRFGGLTYLQLFSLFTGLYIVNRTRPMLDNLPFPNDNHSVGYICNQIAKSPRSFASESNIEISISPMFILERDGNVRGDYGLDMVTTFKIP